MWPSPMGGELADLREPADQLDHPGEHLQREHQIQLEQRDQLDDPGQRDHRQ